MLDDKQHGFALRARAFPINSAFLGLPQPIVAATQEEGTERALEIETADGALIRIAVRAK